MPHTILAFSCLHAPYHSSKAFDFLSHLKSEYMPNEIVCMGDESDCYFASRYPKAASITNPVGELEDLRESVAKLAKLFRRMKICVSNHMLRPFKRVEEIGIPAHCLKTWSEIIKAPPTWKWSDDWEIDDIRFVHGESFGGQQAWMQAIQSYQSNVVFGHLHGQAGVNWTQTLNGRFWAAQTGCLVDPKRLVFSYGKHHRRQPVLGAVVIVDGVPTFIPMENER